MKTSSLTLVEVFFLYELVSQKVTSADVTESTSDFMILHGKLRDSLLESLQEMQDDVAAEGFKRWQADTINKIQTLNESMKNIKSDEKGYTKYSNTSRRRRR